MRWHAAIILAVALSSLVASRPALAGEDLDVDKVIRERVDAGYSVGIVIAVVKPEGTKFHAYGRVATDSEQTVNPDTLYELGAITSVFTAAVLTEMVERGDVKLSDPITKYLPEQVRPKSPDGKPITLGQLATHTSGLPRLPDNAAIDANPNNPWVDYSIGDLYSFLSSHEFAAAPGSEWRYSHIGYGLLGHLLAKKTGKGYESLLVDRICNVLRMDSTRITQNEDLAERSAYGHHSDAEVADWNVPALAPAGALWSTGRDLAQFLSASLGLTDTKLKPALASMRQVRTRTSNVHTEQAFGWQKASRFGAPIFFKSSGSGGYRSFLGFCPERKIGVAVLSNSAVDCADIGMHLLHEKYALRDLKKKSAVASQNLDDFEGRYIMPSGLIFLFSRKGDKLMVEQAGVDKLEMICEGADTYRYKMVDARFKFKRDANGAVSDVTLYQSGGTQVGRRIDPKTEPTQIELSATVLGRYVGRYVDTTRGMVFEVSKVGTDLFVQMDKPGAPVLQIYPKAEYEFFYKLVQATITFDRNDANMVNGMTLHMGSQEIKTVRRISNQIGG